MSDCPYGTMEWYCCLQEGHEPPHRSQVLRWETPDTDTFNREHVLNTAKAVEGYSMSPCPGKPVERLHDRRD